MTDVGSQRPDDDHASPTDAHTRPSRVVVALVTLTIAAFVSGVAILSSERSVRVPDLIGTRTAPDRLGDNLVLTLETIGLTVTASEDEHCAARKSDLVVEQLPPAGTVVPVGTTVRLRVCRS